jgi:hypothetical protein
LAHHPFFQGRLDKRGLQTLGQFRRGKLRKRAQKLRLRKNLARLSQPQMRRKEASFFRRFSNCRVSLMLWTALASKEQARHAGSWTAGPRRLAKNPPAPRSESGPTPQPVDGACRSMDPTARGAPGTKALHDSLELIQEAGDDKLRRVGISSTLELDFVTLF